MPSSISICLLREDGMIHLFLRLHAHVKKQQNLHFFLIGSETIPEKPCSDWLKIRFDILPTGFGFLQLCLNERQ